MSEKINPYYNPEKLDLEMIDFDEPNMSYEFNTLCFWATKDGRVFTASDSGCSCPTPFEDFEGETQDDVLKLLERVGSVAQAETTFDSWNRNYDGKPLLQHTDREKAIEWVKSHIKQ